MSLIRDLPDAQYHRDPDSLSQSGAKLLLRSPALYRWRLDNPQPPSETFDFGHVAHKLVLGAGADIEVIDADSWRTKAAKEAQEAARGAGKVPVLTGDFDRAKALADAVLSHSTAGRLFSDGEAEVSFYWEDDQTGSRLRGRADWLRSNCIADLKSCADASPSGFARSAANYGYGQQVRWYQDGLEAITGERLPFFFVAVEKEPPHLIGIYSIDEQWEAIADTQNRRAIDLYAECVRSGEWPDFADSRETLAAPRWLTYQESA